MYHFVKLLPLFIFLSAFYWVNAQTPISLSGKVTDKTTGQALPYATIKLVGTSIGTTTNQAGNFVFRIPSAISNPVVAFSYLGYQSVRLEGQNRNQHQLTITLEPNAVKLKEVVVRPIDPLQIITKSLEKLAKNYASQPYKAEGFQREYVTAGHSVIQLLEVAFRSAGSTQTQSTTVLEAQYVEDKKEKAPLWNPSRGGFYTLGWTSVTGIESPSPTTFLGVELKKTSDLSRYYTFEFKNTIRLDGKEVYVIGFDQKRQVKKPLLTGTIYIDAESDAIVKLEHQVSLHGLSYLKAHQTWGGLTISKSPKRLAVQQDRWVTTYKQFGQKWYLSSLVIDTDFSASLVVMGLVQARKDSLRLHSERIVTTIDTTTVADLKATSNIADVGSIPTLQNFIKKEYENRTTTWDNVNYIQSDTALAGLACQLKAKNEQWEVENRKRTVEKVLTRQAYTARQLTEDLAYLRESLEKIHPGLNWYTDKASLDRAFGQLRSKLPKTSSEAEFYQLLSPLIEQIHCGHTELYPSKATQDYQALVGKAFPLNLWITGDSAVVSQGYGAIPKGATVVSINGYDQTETIRRIRSVIASDGYNQTYKSFRLQHEFPALFARHVQPADTFAVKFRNLSGQIRTIRLAGGKRTTPTSQYATAQIHDSLQTVVLTIPSFGASQNFPDFLNETFIKIAQRQITTLVIDLRNNQGGSDDYGALLYAYLTDQPFPYYRRISVATIDSSLLNRLSVDDAPLLRVLPNYLSSVQKQDGVYAYTNHPNLGLQQPRPNGFKGTVYVLINGGTFSAAAEFAAIVRSHKRGIFIGEEAGGGYFGNCSLATPLLTLPNSKLRLAVPLARYELAVSPEGSVGHGVLPDHETIYRLEDLLSNMDKELKYGLDLIRKTKN